MNFCIKDFCSKCDQIRGKMPDLVTFTKEMLNGKLRFLCSARILIHFCYRLTMVTETLEESLSSFLTRKLPTVLPICTQKWLFWEAATILRIPSWKFCEIFQNNYEQLQFLNFKQIHEIWNMPNCWTTCNVAENRSLHSYISVMLVSSKLQR